MAYNGLRDFRNALDNNKDLEEINEFVDPVLEIAEMADRAVKAGYKALYFNNNGTDFPVFINMFASDSRMSMAIGRDNLDDAGEDIEELFKQFSTPAGNLASKLKLLPGLAKVASFMPKKISRKGRCQQNIIREPDLGILPVLKCWPHDGGRFITLPVVHTKHPVTGEVNAGMYRMQILDKNTTAMHWHRHKTGAVHYEAWKEKGEKMPVSVVLGGDPVYTYAATAPLPEGIDEYILAGFLRKKKVKMVKCITNDLHVPEDADIVIEGYVDPSEKLVWEGPFGDHTGFYSLADWFPAFHVTCITHRNNAVYPATIVGIPPMEDAWIGKATEKLFLAPIKLSLQPEITDLHLPVQGVAHNLVLVKIKKTYPGQGMKVISSLFGAGQMMFSKFIVVMNEDIDIRDYNAVAEKIFSNTDINRDILFTRGPLDILDHSSDTYSFGGKMGIDATLKFPEESGGGKKERFRSESLLKVFKPLKDRISLKKSKEMPVVFAGISKDNTRFNHLLDLDYDISGLVLIAVDHSVDLGNDYILLWQILSNIDPSRDISIRGTNIFIDATSKSHPSDNFSREWPNVVVSDDTTIEKINMLSGNTGITELKQSPSEKLKELSISEGASVK